MCVIIYKPAGVKISDAILRSCMIANNHGAGFAFRANNKIVAKKGFFNLRTLKVAIGKYDSCEGVVHFRLRSAGLISGKFCHPFKIDSRYLFHNGHIPKLGTQKTSDTYKLAQILKRLSYNDQIELLEDLELRGDGRFALVGSQGVDLIGEFQAYEGLFFSNLHWLYGKPVKVPKGDDYFMNCPKCHSKAIWNKVMCSQCGHWF